MNKSNVYRRPSTRKLTPEQVMFAREQYARYRELRARAKACNPEAIARALGVHRSSIYELLAGRTYYAD